MSLMHIEVIKNGSGYVPAIVEYVIDEIGEWEGWDIFQVYPFPFDDKEQAVEAAKLWAKDEELDYRE